ncbi:MAG: ferrous iron transport protein B [Verrucomicrobiota bacterium]|nr:ferrous iron transport protein B [Verrucomicrobiota bacterium]
MPIPVHLQGQKPIASQEAPAVFAVVGNPNSGKTTLFNALTGLRQKVANYPGVTVERKEGVCYSQHGKPIRIIDLPGAYSLSARSPDEAIMQDVLLGRRPDTPRPDAVICVLDASNVERHLFLATQVLEIGLPVIIVLNMMDLAAKRGLKVNAEKLSRALGVTVVAAQANKGDGLTALRIAMSRADLKASPWRCPVPQLFSRGMDEMQKSLRETSNYGPRRAYPEAFLLLTDEPRMAVPGSEPLSTATTELAHTWQKRLDQEIPGWRSELVVLRYNEIGTLVREVVQRINPEAPGISERIDRYLLHPVWGFLVLGTVLGMLFFSIFSLAAPLMDAIDGLTGWVGGLLAQAMPAGDLRNLVVDGVVAGVGGVVIFLPQILLLFFFIGLLENTGYMARAAFLLDRVMSKVGLHGKSFIPLLSSYACTIPGIMATRTIESPKDRLVTILVAPFMTCSARLPVYLLMIATLVPVGTAPAALKAGLLLMLYALGTGGAFFFAWFFKKTLLKGVTPSLVMELPAYRMPAWLDVLREMGERAVVFLKNAGTVILGLSILLWFLMNFPKAPAGEEHSQLSYSMAGKIGRVMEPVMQPLGFDWRINIGVVGSFAAREIFVSTMAITYNVDNVDDDNNTSLVESLHTQKRADGSPVFTPLTCLSLMVFYVFALQCTSTLAVVRRETNSWRWPLFMLGYMTTVAWVGAFIVYQGGRLLGFH